MKSADNYRQRSLVCAKGCMGLKPESRPAGWRGFCPEGKTPFSNFHPTSPSEDRRREAGAKEKLMRAIRDAANPYATTH